MMQSRYKEKIRYRHEGGQNGRIVCDTPDVSQLESRIFVASICASLLQKVGLSDER